MIVRAAVPSQRHKKESQGCSMKEQPCRVSSKGQTPARRLIEVLGAVAEQERKKTEQRQADRIAAMPIVDGKRVVGQDRQTVRQT